MGPNYQSTDLIGAGLLGTGALLAVLSALLMLGRDLVQARPGARPGTESAGRLWPFVAVCAVLIAVALRVYGLGDKGLSHPEAYIPNIDLPPDVSTPPPRHGLAETIGFHFFWEPHPFGYYLGMWAWTKAFGTSLFAMRLPEALFGAASVWLAFQVGRLAYSARVGALAAVVLAVHGFHVFWSQMARMYAPGAFFGLLATWLLLLMARRGGKNAWLEAGYIGAIAASALTVEFTWPLLAMHLLWTALRRGSERLARIETLAFLIASPMLAHALIGARTEATSAPTLDFIAEYFHLGYLFYREDFPVALAPSLLVVAFVAVLLVLGLRARSEPPQAGETGSAPYWPLPLAAAGALVMIGGIAVAVPDRRPVIAAAGVVPLVVLAAPMVMALVSRFAEGLPTALREHLRSVGGLVALLALAPPVLIWLVSYAVELAAARAYLQFVPYLAVLAVAGLFALWPRKALFVPMAAALAALLGAGLWFQHNAPSSPRDYQALGRAMVAQRQKGDLVFTRNHDWAYTPVYYYIGGEGLVAEDYAAAVARSPGARVWVLSFLRQPPTAEMQQALAGYRTAGKVEALEASATLYEPAPPGRTGP